jgi:hypothetical protein
MKKLLSAVLSFLAIGLTTHFARGVEPTWNYAVQVSASVQILPPQITLAWPQDTTATPNSYTVYRKAPTATSWGGGTTLPGGTTSYTDTGVIGGTAYEYAVVKNAGTYNGYGYIEAGINVPLVENRGKVVLIVDSTYAANLSAELSRLQQDLAGDGWIVLRHDVGRSDSVVSVKNLIKADYNADPANVKSVFLFGHVPVPYSGQLNPDGHPDHVGAWPADVYYGDMDGNWTDNSVNYTQTVNTDPADAARLTNVPGDGKFDQTTIPSAVELQVGRVDLANMPGRLVWGGPTTFPGEQELLRQYLNKDHNFRHKITNPQRRGVIADYFGVRNGEAFSASAYRGFSTFFGPNNISNLNAIYNDTQGVWVPTLATNDFLCAYGCGAGSYSTISGLGNGGNYNAATTPEIVNNNVRAVFTLLFGSWNGDWDHEDDFLRSVLATKDYGLAAAWSGRPHWFVHPMGLGETIGYCARLTQNNSGFYQNQINSAANCIHIALMGDPTLRLHSVAPVGSLGGTAAAGTVTLAWTPSPDSPLGYHVYRALSAAGPFTRLTSSPLSVTSFLDSSAPSGATYMVRAVKLENTPSGSYYNASQGMFWSAGGVLPPLGDTTAPTVAVSAPANGATVSGSSVTVSATATDNVGVTGVQFKLDGANLGAEDTSAPYGMTLNTTALADGAHTLSAVARDAAGNQTTSAPISVSVNNSTPTNPPPTSATNDVVWMDDALPAGAWTGADYGDSWNWVSSNPTPNSGSLAHQSALVSGVHSHYFSGATATLQVGVGDKLFTYVYLDPANPPEEVMLMWSDGISWSHAAYWGANLIQWGANGTASQYPAGALPAAGQWVRLEVPASLVALEGTTLSGMQFVLYDGRAAFDRSGKSSETAAASDATPPAISMSAPANGATVSGSSATVSAIASDNAGVASVQFKLDGANLGAVITTAPYSLSWDSTAVADGSHSLTAVAADAAGNQATAILAMITVSNSSVVTNLSYAALPGWVGPASHNWKPRLGGVYWLDSLAVVKQAAPYLQQSSKPVLVDIKTDATGFGYRFDLNSWDAKSAIHSYYSWDGTDNGTPASPEDALNIFGATGKAEFILNIPIPLFLTNSPSSNWGYDGFGYTWQTAQFYAAMTQYLVGTAGPQSEWQNLPVTLDFFSQPASFNWANLRARRGHLAPYPVVAFIIGSEPYNIEGTLNGSLYGPQAEKFRAAIRNRGVSNQLGLHVHDMGYVDDPQRLWFWPMMSAVTASDFSFMDLEHYYQFSSVQEDFKRTFPVSVNPNAAYWMPKSSWKSDYTKYLWIVEDTRNAIRDDNTVAGLGDPSRWQLGFSEHGIQVTSQFTYNDMFSAMHWAGWLAESMRQNVAWDSGWTLVAEGFSHGQLQVRNGYVTRTPMFFVYQMAQEFYGYDYLTNSYSSVMGSTTDNIGNPVQFPWTTVRTFRDPVTGNIHLFVLNQSLTDTATISGFENWNVVSWKQLKGASYSDNNPLGVAGPESIQTVAVSLPDAGLPLVIAPVSVNHIVLAGSIDTGVPVPDLIAPAISITAPTGGATVSGSSVTVSANASDNVGVTGVQFKLDGANLSTEDTSAPYSVTLNTTMLTDGAHTLSAVARDAAGNQATAAAISVTISNSAPASTPTVTITSVDTTATEGSSDAASFTLTRTGSTANDLIVTLQSSGTATKWDDYRRPVEGDMPDAWTIPAGASSVTITIVAVDDTLVEGTETATLTIQPGTNYNVGTPNSVTLTLLDNDSGTVPPNPTVTVVANDANASRVGPDNGAITITRSGSTTSALAVNYSLGGTAVNGTDYNSLGASVTIPAGASSAVITIVPKSVASYVGSKTVTLTLSANAAYIVGSPNSASVTIAGNNVPVTSLRKAPANGGMVITWSSQAGKIYRVAYKINLTDPWVDLSGSITTTGSSTSWTDNTAGASKQRFYAVYVTN